MVFKDVGEDKFEHLNNVNDSRMVKEVRY